MRPRRAVPFAVMLSLFALQYSIYLVDTILWDRIIKLGLLFLLIVFFRYRGIPPPFRRTLALFAALFITAGVGSISAFDMGGVVQLLKLILAFSIVPLIVLRFRPGDAPAPAVVKIFLLWGFLFAIQALALWARVLQGDPPPRTLISIERLESMPEWDLGIYGFGNGLGWLADGYFYFRPQGWFTEPSGLSAFLLYPSLVSVGIFLTTHKLRHLMIAIVCWAGLLSAFSLAGYMALMAGLLSLVILRPVRGRHLIRPRRPWYYWMIPIVLALGFVVCAQLVMKQTYNIHQEGSLWGKRRVHTLLGRDPDQQRLVQKYYRVGETAKLIVRQPLGIGLGNTMGYNETTSMNAVVYWAVAGGFPALIVIGLLFTHLFYTYCLPVLTSRIPYYRWIGASFVGASVHALSYGSWMTPSYLMVLALMIVAAGHETRLRVQARRLALASHNHAIYEPRPLAPVTTT